MHPECQNICLGKPAPWECVIVYNLENHKAGFVWCQREVCPASPIP